MSENKAKVSRVIINVFVLVVGCILGFYIINGRISCNSLPKESTIVSNLESSGFDVDIDTEVTKDDMKTILSFVIGSCRENGIGEMLLSAYDFEIENAYSSYDSVEKIIVANRYRITDNVIETNGEVVTLEKYFGSGIILFYFNSKESAEDFYEDLEWVFDNISVYYERTVYNLFDDEIKHGTYKNIVFLGTKEAYNCSKY